MTNEEAIEILKKERYGLLEILEMPLDRNPHGTIEALDIAIEALTVPEREKGTNGSIITEMVEQDDDFCIMTDVVNDTVSIDVSLKWWNTEYKGALSVPENTDLISREKALTELEAHKLPKQYCIDHNIDETIDMGMVRIILNQLPSANPEIEKGEWVRWYEKIEGEGFSTYEPHCKCPKCNKEQDPYESKFINFCPNCGADMRGGKE